MLSSNKKPALQRVVRIQNLKMDLSSASISRDRFFSPSRYCGVRTSPLGNCSSLGTTDRGVASLLQVPNTEYRIPSIKYQVPTFGGTVNRIPSFAKVAKDGIPL